MLICVINNYIVWDKVFCLPTHFDPPSLASIDAFPYNSYYCGVCQMTISKNFHHSFYIFDWNSSQSFLFSNYLFIYKSI